MRLHGAPAPQRLDLAAADRIVHLPIQSRVLLGELCIGMLRRDNVSCVLPPAAKRGRQPVRDRCNLIRRRGKDIPSLVRIAEKVVQFAFGLRCNDFRDDHLYRRTGLDIERRRRRGPVVVRLDVAVVLGADRARVGDPRRADG